jgi:S1-C subfamily serine protease
MRASVLFGRASVATSLVAVVMIVAPAAAADPPPSFAPAVQAVHRSVVSVMAPLDEREDDDGEVDADEESSAARLLRRLFDALGESSRTLGAAVVIDRAGLAVTSLRTLRGYERVDILTVDGARLPATVVGRDQRTDIAGVQAGDLVREVAGRVVRTVSDAERLVAGLSAGRDVVILLQRGTRAFFAGVAVRD